MSENTLNKPGEFDALEKAKPDELLFALLERDPCAPPTILHWADLRRTMARKLNDPDKREAELRQCMEAEMIAFEMESRQRGQAPRTEIKQTYSGVVPSGTESDVLMPKLRNLISNADALVHEAIEVYSRLGEIDPGRLNPFQLVELSDAGEAIHHISMALIPNRAALLAEAELPLGEKSDG